MTAKHNYVRVRTDQLVDDMTRYMGYCRRRRFLYGEMEDGGPEYVDFVPETPEPIKQQNLGRVHRFSEGEYTYFMQPTIFNAHWNVSMIERYASFGVTAEKVRR